MYKRNLLLVVFFCLLTILPFFSVTLNAARYHGGGLGFRGGVGIGHNLNYNRYGNFYGRDNYYTGYSRYSGYYPYYSSSYSYGYPSSYYYYGSPYYYYDGGGSGLYFSW